MFKIQNLKHKTFKYLFGICFLFFVILAPTGVYAATLYFSPSSGNFTVGDILTTSVLVNTQEKAINNSDATINFPTGLLEIVSVSKSGSIFSLWVEEPSFSNSAGTLSYNGGLPTPGFNGSAGKIISIVFRVKSTGLATLIFSSGAVRANDGYGTDILKTRAQAQFTLLSEERPVQPAIIAIGTPAAPKVSSPTHPDFDQWYSNDTATFSWLITSDITATRLLVGKMPTVTPSVLYIPPISQKSIERLEDGVWYFHAQLKNDSGWGGITHFRFQIDTQAPEPFSIKFVEGKETTNPQPMVLFNTTDSLSGIDHYRIKIGEGDTFRLEEEEVVIKGNPYTLPLQFPGKRSLLVQAFDKAGNYTTAIDDFTIKPIASPVITEYPKELTSGEILIIKGTSYPNASVTIWFQRENYAPKSQIIKSDKDGNFTLVAEERLKDGIYKLWAEAVDERGARSYSTETMIMAVKPSTFLQIGRFAIGFLSVLIPLIVLILILLFVLWYGRHKFLEFRKKLKKEVREAESALHKAFDLLKEDIREQVKMLERVKTRRQLTEEEEKIIKQLRKHLDVAERYISKEIEDIEKEVE